MPPSQDTVIQVLVALALWLLGLRGFRGVMRRYIDGRWAETSIQALIFTFLVATIGIFESQPSFAPLRLAGVVMAGLTITAWTAYLQESSTRGTRLEDWFGSDARSVLDGISRDNAILNRAVLTRMSSFLRAKGHITTDNACTDIVLKHLAEDSSFVYYDATETFDLSAPVSRTIRLVWEIRPSWCLDLPYDTSYPPVPMSSRSADDKWQIAYTPPMRLSDLPRWHDLMNSIDVVGWLRNQDTRSMKKIEFTKKIESTNDLIGHNRSHISWTYCRFEAVVTISRDLPSIQITTRNVPHPYPINTLYFYAWDLVLRRWEFKVSQHSSPADLHIQNVIPYTISGDVAISRLRNDGQTAELRIEAAEDSCILPLDGVIVRFEHKGATSVG